MLDIDYVPSEIAPDFLGVVGLNNFSNTVSGSRLAMMAGHVGQAIVASGATKKRLLTGMEREYGKYLFDIKFECMARIITVIHKYREVMGSSRIRAENNPLVAVIYENMDAGDGRLCIMYLKPYHCIHQYFGFSYVYTEHVHRLVPGATIEAGTVIATSPNIDQNGDYKFGIGAKVALMSVPAVTEDGIEVSESFLKKMKTKGYGTRTVSWGRQGMPLNLHGDYDSYKVLPDIGERVGDTGLLMATRQMNDELAPAMLSRSALRRVDFTDRTIYVPSNAKIIDITVHRGGRDKNHLPVQMTEQLKFYHERSMEYHGSIVKEYKRLRDVIGDENLALDPALSRQIMESIALTRIAEGKSVTPTYNRQPVDDYLVTVSFEYDIIPNIGFKLTGMYGNKGVICRVKPDEDMPVDELGVRAEIVMDAQSIFKRMNPGVFYEQYINASGYATVERIKKMRLSGVSDKEIFAYLMDFYRIVSPWMYDMIKEEGIESVSGHIDELIKPEHKGGGMFIFMPTNNPRRITDIIKHLRNKYPAHYGPVVYRGNSGLKVRTVSPILIGEMYILVLEKIGNTWSSVSSSRCTVNGIPARLTNADKYANPGRHNPVRAIGESEGRAYEAFCNKGDPGETGIVAEIFDLTNNPQAHEHVCFNLIHAHSPTAIPEIIDRNIVPLGNGRIVLTMRHVMECGGAEFVWGDYR